MPKTTESDFRSSRAYAIACFQIFAAMAVLSVTPLAETADTILAYVGLPVILALSIVALHQWWKRHTNPEAFRNHQPTLARRIVTLLQRFPPFI